MQLCVIRHGKAVGHGEAGGDFARALTDRGRRQAAYLGDRLLTRGPRPAGVIASPLVRAQETGSSIASALGLLLRTDDRLSTASDAGRILELIAELQYEVGGGPEAAAAIVGHNPTLSVLVDLLVHGIGGSQTELRTGQMAVIELREAEPGAGRLVLVDRLSD